MGFSFRRVHSSSHSRGGFTLIEILVVITIIAILTASGMVAYIQIGKNARDARRKSDLEQLRSALVLYRTDFNAYPASVNWSNMSPIQNYISSASMSDPKGVNYSYTSDTVTFQVCATLENTTPASYCVKNP